MTASCINAKFPCFKEEIHLFWLPKLLSKNICINCYAILHYIFILVFLRVLKATPILHRISFSVHFTRKVCAFVFKYICCNATSMLCLSSLQSYPFLFIFSFRQSGSKECNIRLILDLLDTCLSHTLTPNEKKQDPPHSKISAELLSCLFKEVIVISHLFYCCYLKFIKCI